MSPRWRFIIFPYKFKKFSFWNFRIISILEAEKQRKSTGMAMNANDRRLRRKKDTFQAGKAG